MHDGQLLGEFVERGSQAAFGQIVGRHLNLVYSVCRREVGETTLAEDAAQAVFLLLARKAPALRREPSLAGWLFQAARLTSKDALKQDTRRRRREQEAARDMAQSDTGNALWDEIEPYLDGALAALGRTEREAVLLRVFEGHSLAETGARIGVSEEAARKRVSRALDKVRGHLRGAGIAVPVVALSALLSEKAVRAAPRACAVSVSLITSSAAPSAQVAQLTEGASKAMSIMKLKTAVLITIGTVGLSGGTYLAHARATAPNLAAGRNKTLAPIVDAVPQRQAAAESTITGRIRYEDGRPAPGIMVSARVQSRDAGLIFTGRKSGAGAAPGFSASDTSGADGFYRLIGLKAARYDIIEMAGWSLQGHNNPTEWVAAAVPMKTLPDAAVRAPDLVLTHGAVIAGTVVNKAGETLPNVYVYSLGPRYPASMGGSSQTQTDSSGRYSLRVAPGDNWIYLSGGYQTQQTSASLMNPGSMEHGFPVRLAKGQTKSVTIRAIPGAR